VKLLHTTCDPTPLTSFWGPSKGRLPGGWGVSAGFRNGGAAGKEGLGWVTAVLPVLSCPQRGLLKNDNSNKEH
jgi:hypothetical protein